jgi:hypothetical protein
MATTKEEGAAPDFLCMDQPVSSDPTNAKKTGNWHGWPTKDINPVTLTDDEGRTVRIRTPVMDLEGLITPTNLHYTSNILQCRRWSRPTSGNSRFSVRSRTP